MERSKQTNGQASRDGDKLANYSLPRQRLRQVMRDASKDPLVLVACGYLSPVSDGYKKAGLARAQDRLEMCEIAVRSSLSLLDVDPWEAIQTEYTPTALVLDHLEHEINTVQGGIKTANGEQKQARIALLAGADLLLTMSVLDVWSPQDLTHILTHFPLLILERTGTDLDTAIAQLAPFKGVIHRIPQLVHNDISSTKIRLFCRRGLSIRYLVPDEVIAYIEARGLYRDDGALVG